MPKLNPFAGPRAPEVWRWEGDRMTFYLENDGTYVTPAHSRLIPPLTTRLVTEFVTSRDALSYANWHRSVVEWVRSR